MSIDDTQEIFPVRPDSGRSHMTTEHNSDTQPIFTIGPEDIGQGGGGGRPRNPNRPRGNENLHNLSFREIQSEILRYADGLNSPFSLDALVGERRAMREEAYRAGFFDNRFHQEVESIVENSTWDTYRANLTNAANNIERQMQASRIQRRGRPDTRWNHRWDGMIEAGIQGVIARVDLYNYPRVALRFSREEFAVYENRAELLDFLPTWFRPNDLIGINVGTRVLDNFGHFPHAQRTDPNQLNQLAANDRLAAAIERQNILFEETNRLNRQMIERALQMQQQPGLQGFNANNIGQLGDVIGARAGRRIAEGMPGGGGPGQKDAFINFEITGTVDDPTLLGLQFINVEFPPGDPEREMWLLRYRLAAARAKKQESPSPKDFSEFKDLNGFTLEQLDTLTNYEKTPHLICMFLSDIKASFEGRSPVLRSLTTRKQNEWRAQQQRNRGNRRNQSPPEYRNFADLKDEDDFKEYHNEMWYIAQGRFLGHTLDQIQRVNQIFATGIFKRPAEEQRQIMEHDNITQAEYDMADRARKLRYNVSAAYNFVMVNNVVEDLDREGIVFNKYIGVINMRTLIHPRLRVFTKAEGGEHWPANVIGEWARHKEKEGRLRKEKIPLNDGIFKNFLSDDVAGRPMFDSLIQQGEKLWRGENVNARIKWSGMKESPYFHYWNDHINAAVDLSEAISVSEDSRPPDFAKLTNIFKKLGTVQKRTREMIVYLYVYYGKTQDPEYKDLYHSVLDSKSPELRPTGDVNGFWNRRRLVADFYTLIQGQAQIHGNDVPEGFNLKHPAYMTTAVPKKDR